MVAMRCRCVGDGRDRHVGVAAQNLWKMALPSGVQVRDNHKRHSSLVWHGGEQCHIGAKGARRSNNADDDGRLLLIWHKMSPFVSVFREYYGEW